MTDFSKAWETMSAEQRAQHIVRDWQESRNTNDPMVLRVAAVVAHAVLSDALVAIENLRAERDEARRRLCVELFEVEGHPFGWTGARGAKGIAERLGWDCFKEDSK